MDRNTAIGMTLMGALLLAYFYFFPGTPPQPTPVADSVKTQSIQPNKELTTTLPAIDSAQRVAMQGFGAFVSGTEQFQTFENSNEIH